MFIDIIPDPNWNGEKTWCIAIEHIVSIKKPLNPSFTRIDLTDGSYTLSYETYESFRARLNELTQKS